MGGHRLVAPLGHGGMAVVWRAVRLRDGAEVALKLVAPERASSPVIAERFLREVRASTRLRHPHVVEVYDGGRDGAELWMAMELLRGESLHARVRRGALPVPEAARVAGAVASALAYAHGAGVLHRDVKGGNVMLSDAGAVKLVDFGIARTDDAATLTATGDIVGTLTHLAPELARGERASPASDLYALGVTLFEALTGRLPFTGGGVMLVMHHARSAPPRVRALAPEVPEALDALVDALLAKEPSWRPRDAAVVHAALAPWAGAAADPRAVAQAAHDRALDACAAALREALVAAAAAREEAMAAAERLRACEARVEAARRELEALEARRPG